MIYTAWQKLAGINKWIKKMYLLTTMVCYKAIVCSLFTVLIELEHLCSMTFSSLKPQKIRDAELHFIMYKFIFSEQIDPFFPTTDINLQRMLASYSFSPSF